MSESEDDHGKSGTVDVMEDVIGAASDEQQHDARYELQDDQSLHGGKDPIEEPTRIAVTQVDDYREHNEKAERSRDGIGKRAMDVDHERINLNGERSEPGYASLHHLFDSALDVGAVRTGYLFGITILEP